MEYCIVALMGIENFRINKKYKPGEYSESSALLIHKILENNKMSRFVTIFPIIGKMIKIIAKTKTVHTVN